MDQNHGDVDPVNVANNALRHLREYDKNILLARATYQKAYAALNLEQLRRHYKETQVA